MKWIVNILVLFCLSTTVGMFINGCVHDPEFTITNPVDTNQVDPSGSNCDSTKVYFQNQIAPIFNSSCALAGCHDAIKHEEGIILDSYENIIRTGKIRAFDLNAGEIYDKITDSDPKDRMPPPPMSALSTEQKNLIAQWILQGATNDSCVNTKNCDTIAVSYSKEIAHLTNTNCKVCHSGNQPLGNLSLTNYNEVRSIAVNGSLVCVINWKNGCVPMPKGGKKLDACSISKIQAWINQGLLNN
ncbi:MAG: hypothetical protein JNL65_13980 [Saprospiraceae bacterium]|nr:hypothetical protein [Saprospiraceae bacterium]